MSYADFNQDGKSDLAVVNFSDNNVSILLGDGLGSFAAATNFSVGTSPISVSSADFNQDGKIDLEVANESGDNTSILLGNGLGSFSSAVNFNVGDSPEFISSADFNQDGIVDLTTFDANFDSNAFILLGYNANTAPSLKTFTSVVSGGDDFSLALKSDGTVWAWGSNSFGQLGDGTTTDRLIPVQVSGLSGITNIAGGAEFSIALKSDGTVWVWGRNNFGQLGDGTTTDSHIPIQVSGLTGITNIAGGFYHSLALKNDGTVYSWGLNDNGQLGDGTTTDRLIPVQVSGLTGVTSITGGHEHSLALKSDGTVWAWGDNTYGQLGDGTTTDRHTPVQTSGLTGIFTNISVGEYHSLALKNDGTVFAWGNNGEGELGDGTNTNRTTPVQVPGFSGITNIAGGYSHSLALKNDGTVFAWGNNGEGELGDGTNTQSSSPVQVSGLTGIVSLTGSGGYHSLALKNDGTVFAWGYNSNGQLGNNTIIDSNIPIQTHGVSDISFLNLYATPVSYNTATVYGNISDTGGENASVHGFGYGTTSQTVLGNYDNTTTDVVGAPFSTVSFSANLTNLSCGTTYYFRAYATNTFGTGLGNEYSFRTTTCIVPTIATFTAAIDGGWDNTIALKSDGTVWDWGDNSSGQLGIGNTTDSNVPVQVSSLSDVIAITGGTDFHLALKGDGTVWAWGNNGVGNLGDGTLSDRHSPVRVDSLSGITAIAEGAAHSIALKNDGTVWSWGGNDVGQLGDGTNIVRSSPVQVSGLTNIVSISTGIGGHSFAIKNDGTVWAWGWNFNGQLGDGTNTDRNIPVQISSLTNVASISAGEYHSFAIKNDGTVWAWGANSFGQLGDGTTTQRLSPVQISSLTGIASIVGGELHSLAIKADGTMLSWGRNNVGQLGNGTTTDSHVPIQVPGFSNAKTVSTGESHTTVFKNDGTVWGWGDNSNGTQGDNTTTNSSVPVQAHGVGDVGFLNLYITTPSYNTATVYGDIVDTGGSNNTVRGFGYDTTSHPTSTNISDYSITGVVTTDTVGAPFNTGDFLGNLTGLTCGTTYYYRAYATNSTGTGLGNEYSFITTACVLPVVVTTTPLTTIGQTSAILLGNITSVVSANVTTTGFHYGTDSTLTTFTDVHTGSQNISSAPTSFSENISGLNCATIYYYQAYATNIAGTATGTIENFTTSACTVILDHNNGHGPGTGPTTVVVIPPVVTTVEEAITPPATPASPSVPSAPHSNTPAHGSQLPLLTPPPVSSPMLPSTPEPVIHVPASLPSAPVIEKINVGLKIVSTASVVAAAAISLGAGLFASPLAGPELVLIPIRLWSLLLTALGLRKRIKPWGVIYDAVTKQPLDPVYVSLLSLEGKEVASCITDINGRYGFFVEPGVYKVSPKRTNYIFPSSALAKHFGDEMYQDLYFGDYMNIGAGQVIAKNIPMDPLSFDWNEFAKNKQKLLNFYSKKELRLARISNYLFIFGFAISLVALAFSPKIYNIIISSLYVVMFFVRRVSFKFQAKGKLLDKDGTPLSFAIIRVFSVQTNVELAHSVADQMGRYYMILPNGTYYMRVEKKNDDGTYMLVNTSDKFEVLHGTLNKVFKF